MRKVKKAYRERSLEVHPDHSGLPGRWFVLVNDAYEAIKDNSRRNAYNRSLNGHLEQSVPADNPYASESNYDCSCFEMFTNSTWKISSIHVCLDTPRAPTGGDGYEHRLLELAKEWGYNPGWVYHTVVKHGKRPYLSKKYRETLARRAGWVGGNTWL